MSTIKLSSPETHGFWEIPIEYEDADLLALNKPAGLLSAPDPLQPDQPSLMRLLHAGIEAGKPWALEHGLGYLMNACRLEAEATGLVIFAKNKPAFAALANLFGSEKPVLRYLGLVRGVPEQDEFQVDAPLAPHPVRPELIRVDPRGGKRSRTRITVTERFRRWAVVHCEPLTLRIDQVRAHLRYLGHPLMGDSVYGGKPLMLSTLKNSYRLKPNRSERPLIGRPALHAGEMVFPHPVSGIPVTITAPLPKDLAVALKYLRKYALQEGTSPGHEALQEDTPPA